MIALTHIPSPNLDHGQRTLVAREVVDYELALRQHADYCRLLQECGAEVVTLDVNCDQPDSTFIEDTAVVLDEISVLASMGTASRRMEPSRIEPELRKYREVARIKPPATLEGGDVLRIGRTILIGLSERTKISGVQAFEKIVGRFGYRVLPVPVRQCLHLKTACTALFDGRLLINPSWLDLNSLHEFYTLAVPDDEPWAANTLPINGRVLISSANPRTAEMLRRLGFEVCTLSLSEFAKLEGCVTCLSLLFRNLH
jgi:dimethylargininase